MTKRIKTVRSSGNVSRDLAFESRSAQPGIALRNHDRMRSLLSEAD